MRPRIPGPVKEEYEYLYLKLNDAARMRGEVGRAATAAFRHMQAHYEKDHEFALPPLKLLPSMAADNVNEETDQIQTMCDRLKNSLPHMIDENGRIIQELSRMADVAAHEQKPEYHDLALRFIRFLELEREVLYPATVMIGEFVRAQIDLKGCRTVRSHTVQL